MKSLRDYKLNLGSGHSAETEGITWGTAFTPPIHGLVNGLPVRILAVGDLPGASPVYLCAGSDGISAPVKVNDSIITDGAYLPLTAEPPHQTAMR